MRAGRWLLIAVLVVGAPARADRAAPPPTRAAEIEQMIARGAGSEARRAAEALVAATPGDPEARYVAALTLATANELARADAHAVAGLASATGPTAARLLAVRAHLAELRADDPAAAALARQALAIDATEPTARAIQRRADLAARYAAGIAPPVAPAAAFVHQFLALIAAGGTADEIAARIDPEILLRAPPEVPRTHEAVAALVARAAAAARGPDGFAFRAWEVTGAGDPIEVDVLVDMVWTADRVERLRRAYADPAARATIDPDTRAAFDGLDPGERDAALGRAVGQRRRAILPLRVRVEGTGAAMRIADLEFNRVSVRYRWIEQATAGPAASVTAEAAAGPDRTRWWIAGAAGAVLLVGGGIAVWRRRRPR